MIPESDEGRETFEARRLRRTAERSRLYRQTLQLISFLDHVP